MKRRVASEAELAVAALLCWGGARAAIAIPLWPAVMALVIAVGLRRPLVLVCTVVVLTTSLSARAHDDYRQIQPGTGAVIGRLVVDPRPSGTIVWRAEIATEGGERLLVNAVGPPAWTLERATAGELIALEGSWRPLRGNDWYRSRHLVGALSASKAVIVEGSPSWQQPAEWLRAAVGEGGKLIGSDGEALYGGLVIGDDRFQPESQRSRFRAVGLAHLLAVSGQNVAFALAVAGPLLRRVGLTLGFGLTVLVLLWFAIATRAEPSVVRATLTAVIAAWSVVRGARATGVRALAITIVLALLIDPFLVYSVGFALSCGASAGIVLGSAPLAKRLRGPAWFTTPLSVTLSAQIAVAPLLVGTFGPLSVASIPANVAAGWAAGLVMAWGLSIGILASLLPPWLGEVVQSPASWLVWWIDCVATMAWRLPMPVLDGATMILVLSLCLGIWMVADRNPILRWLLVLGVAATALWSLPKSPSMPTQIAGGGRYWPATESSGAVLLIEARSDYRLVESVVELRISRIDTVILSRGSSTTGRVVTQILELVDGAEVLAPPQHRIVGARRVLAPTEVRTGQGVMLVTPNEDSLSIEGP